MDMNCIVANLNYIGSTVHTLNADCKMLSIVNRKQEFSLDIMYSKPQSVEQMKTGKLLMKIQVEVIPENTEQEPDMIVLVIEGAFCSPIDTPDDDFMELLNINGGAALYSIARAKLEVISSLIYVDGKITLPMINMIQYYKERNRNEK